MLNLDIDSFEFSPENRTYINTLLPHDSDQWSIDTVAMGKVKKQIKKDLLILQNAQCAYCTQDLDTRRRDEEHLPIDGDREHIAAKSDYPEFMFTASNIVLTCITCNRTLKNDLDVIMTHNTNYDDCEFSIVHPYFNNFERHIEFDESFILCERYITQKGLLTINMFELNGVYLTKKRAEKCSMLAQAEGRLLPESTREILKEILCYTG